MVKSDAPVPFEHIVSTEFDQGEGVLVDLNSKQYFQLNATAMLVWECLEKHKSLPEIVNQITDAYDVSSERAAESLEAILKDFQARGLVQSVTGNGR